MVTMSEKTDTYTELCQPYTILGWIEAWNLVHRDADLEDAAKAAAVEVHRARGWHDR